MQRCRGNVFRGEPRSAQSLSSAPLTTPCSSTSMSRTHGEPSTTAIMTRIVEAETIASPPEGEGIVGAQAYLCA
jgi:hypothetical protein